MNHPAQAKDSFHDCGCPCVALSSLFFCALWLQQSHSTLVQEIQSAKDIDLTVFKTRSRSKPPLAPKWCPCPWVGMLILLADPILPDPRFLLMFPAANNNEVLFQLLYALSGDKVLFKHNRKYYNVCNVLLGTPGASLDLFLQDKRTESPNSNTSKKNSWTTTTSFISIKYMVRTSFFRLSRC